MAVLTGYGYRPRSAPLRVTGLASAIGAPVGRHAVNLAAITAALAAGPDATRTRSAAGSPRSRRASSNLLGLGAGVATALVLLSPPVLIEAVSSRCSPRWPARCRRPSPTRRPGRRPW